MFSIWTGIYAQYVGGGSERFKMDLVNGCILFGWINALVDLYKRYQFTVFNIHKVRFSSF